MSAICFNLDQSKILLSGNGLSRGPILRLPGLPVIYFLFPYLVHFWSLHLVIAGVYSMSRISQKFCLKGENAAYQGILHFIPTEGRGI